MYLSARQRWQPALPVLQVAERPWPWADEVAGGSSKTIVTDAAPTANPANHHVILTNLPSRAKLQIALKLFAS